MASIAESFVTVLPETSKIADGIKKALAGVDNDARAAAKRWAKEIEHELKDVRVKVDADTKPAEKKIDKLEKDSPTVDVNVDADTGKAEAQIDAVARDRDVTINVHVNTAAITRALGGVGGAAAKGGIDGITSSVNQLGSAFGAIGGKLGGLVKLEGVIGRNLIGAQHRSRDRLRGQRGRLTVGRVGVAARGGRYEKCAGDAPLLKPTRPVILPGDEGGPILCRAPKPPRQSPN
jgi:hypothetical protein